MLYCLVMAYDTIIEDGKRRVSYNIYAITICEVSSVNHRNNTSIVTNLTRLADSPNLTILKDRVAILNSAVKITNVTYNYKERVIMAITINGSIYSVTHYADVNEIKYYKQANEYTYLESKPVDHKFNLNYKFIGCEYCGVIQLMNLFMGADDKKIKLAPCKASPMISDIIADDELDGELKSMETSMKDKSLQVSHKSTRLIIDDDNVYSVIGFLKKRIGIRIDKDKDKDTDEDD